MDTPDVSTRCTEYTSCIKVNIRLPVCLLGSSLKSTGTLVFIFAVNDTSRDVNVDISIDFIP